LPLRYLCLHFYQLSFSLSPVICYPAHFFAIPVQYHLILRIALLMDWFTAWTCFFFLFKVRDFPNSASSSTVPTIKKKKKIHAQIQPEPFVKLKAGPAGPDMDLAKGPDSASIMPTYQISRYVGTYTALYP
jgi:hypothetical protein